MGLITRLSHRVTEDSLCHSAVKNFENIRTMVASSFASFIDETWNGKNEGNVVSCYLRTRFRSMYNRLEKLICMDMGQKSPKETSPSRIFPID